MTRRVKLIFNPHAQRGRAWEIASSLQSQIERAGGASWSATEYPTHATDLAEQAAHEGYDVVAAIGGDGTVHEVINGLMRLPADRRPKLASVPIGSGNDFASNAGISKEPEVAIQRLFAGEPHRFDIGRLTDNTGRTEYWDNTLGIGFDATVTIRSLQSTHLQGFAMYLWAVILTIVRNHDAPHMTIKTEAESFEHEALMLTLCNGPREGGGFFVAPEAKPDDGTLNYVIIKRVSRPMMFRLIPEVMNGTHGRFKQVRMGKFGQMDVRLARPMTVHADGEVVAGFGSQVTDLRIEVVPGALEVIL